MKSLLKAAILIQVILLLGGCAVFKNKSPQQNWQQQTAQLQRIQQWQFQSKMAIKNGTKGHNINVFWQQEQQNYEIRLSGAFGAGAAHIIGSPLGASFTSAQGTAKAYSLSDLLSQNTNLTLPIEDFPYWLRGVPNPNGKAGIKFGEDGNLLKMEQHGWQIDYLTYMEVNQFVMPKKIKIRKQDQRATIIINKWSL